MLRSLHTKLVLILLLLITSLMCVVGVFLTTSVSSFYTNLFYEQMNDTFGLENADFVNSLRQEAAQEDGALRLQSMIEASSGALGIDSRTRNYYILDGSSGELLSSSDDQVGVLEATPNLLTARNQEVGDESHLADSYMDVAVPIVGGDNFFIVYIRDDRSNATELNYQLFLIILQALLVGLLISVLLSFLLSKTMVSPIERLTEQAKRIAAGQFDDCIAVDSHDEIGVLTNTFNDMAAVLHRTLDAIENERNKLDTLFLHMTDGVIAFDGEGCIIHCNPAASRMLGQSVEGANYASLFADIQDFEELLALQRPHFTEAELTVHERVLELYFAPFSGVGAGGVLTVLHDVTQQHRVEAQRREFVANVSHELRTPLTNVRSYAETLRDNAAVPRAVQNGFLDIIINEADRMTRIVQDLLTLSRLDSGRSEMHMARFAFSDALDSVMRSVELEAKRHQHRLLALYPATLPLIMGDRGRLEQVMLNVIGNAIKYTPDGGTIEVSAGADDRLLWVEVCDNGIGIPPEDRERIFERFYRVDKARSRESGGTGLGLSIALEIVQRHHGTLELAPHEGAGTTVRMTLPLTQTQEVCHEA